MYVQHTENESNEPPKQRQLGQLYCLISKNFNPPPSGEQCTQNGTKERKTTTMPWKTATRKIQYSSTQEGGKHKKYKTTETQKQQQNTGKRKNSEDYS
eukprot:3567017-Ditylum_brightwellii.AAC.1